MTQDEECVLLAQRVLSVCGNNCKNHERHLLGGTIHLSQRWVGAVPGILGLHGGGFGSNDMVCFVHMSIF